MEQSELSQSWGKQVGTTTLETWLLVFIKAEHVISYDLAVLILSIHPKKCIHVTHQKTPTRVFITILLEIALN